MTATALKMLPEMELDVILEQKSGLAGATAAAVFDQSRTYRYLLTRIWDPARPIAVWVMLNPSTADAMTDDATIRRCTTFARDRWGRGGIAVVNLFALRSKDPSLLRTHPDPVGPHNASFVQHVVRQSDLVVAAWGGPGVMGGRGNAMARAMRDAGVGLKAFGFTLSKQPLHPLYLPGGAQLVDYPPDRS
ncbi:DUF1643 domain-containing protein [Streptomyces sp. NPDC005407]|uniref:DUF1643 domain-containing protein n=1 Tax=Streptomyces sp. NPDC005407 TaxID=3155340 RepID=UPI0033A33608